MWVDRGFVDEFTHIMSATSGAINDRVYAPQRGKWNSLHKKWLIAGFQALDIFKFHINLDQYGK